MKATITITDSPDNPNAINAAIEFDPPIVEGTPLTTAGQIAADFIEALRNSSTKFDADYQYVNMLNVTGNPANN